MITEGSRHALFRKFEHILGPEEAVTLMEHLPPVGWADVATKEYVDLRLQATEHALQATIYDQIGHVKDQIGELREEMTRQTRAMVLSISGLTVTMVLGMAGVVVALTG